ncbi:hypothetical protein [Haloimpatiens massiliensis]|uniref:hypothetical protein n=1 Tax=Haloimpatiens massiliensis TaxID=1658110 RepID=UPI000C82704D|nr:hypothetical protein [Haloimpatiens massiliensis]
MNEFYLATTPSAIATILLCVIIENKFPQIFKDDNEKRKIKISVNTSDPIQGTMLIITIFVLLFTPYLNLIISFIYGSSIIIEVIKIMKNKK